MEARGLSGRVGGCPLRTAGGGAPPCSPACVLPVQESRHYITPALATHILDPEPQEARVVIVALRACQRLGRSFQCLEQLLPPARRRVRLLRPLDVPGRVGACAGGGRGVSSCGAQLRGAGWVAHTLHLARLPAAARRTSAQHRALSPPLPPCCAPQPRRQRVLLRLADLLQQRPANVGGCESGNCRQPADEQQQPPATPRCGPRTACGTPALSSWPFRESEAPRAAP